MPTFGGLELTTVAGRLSRLRDLDTEAWSLPGAEILQLSFEVGRATDTLLPRAMHPAIPPYTPSSSPDAPRVRWGRFSWLSSG
jgi:hypothetical protein